MKETVLMFYQPASGNSPAFLSGVAHYARRRGWRLHIIEQKDRQSAKDAVRSFVPIGVLVSGHIDDNVRANRLSPDTFGDIPVVYLDRDPNSFNQPIFCAIHDSAETGRIAAKELLDLNLAAYAYVSWLRPTYWNEQRFIGFRNELASSAPVGKKSVVLFDATCLSETKRQRELSDWLAALPRPAGVFAANDRIAWDVILAADRAGLAVPGDIAVIGVDNDTAICTNSTPDITSIAPDFRHGAELAARLLDERIADPKMEPVTRWFRPVTVVRRGSTDRVAITDPFVSKARATIREKACEGLRAHEVAALLHGSRRHAERRFRAVTGNSILGEIVAVRIERTKELLEKSDIGIAAIANMCGWSSDGYLRRLFKSQTGLSLAEYRKRNRR